MGVNLSISVAQQTIIIPKCIEKLETKGEERCGFLDKNKPYSNHINIPLGINVVSAV